VKLPESGESIVSTIDLDAQSIAAIELRKAVEKNGAKGGMAVFADPRTGDILAMVTVDAAGRTDSGQHRNRVIADQYEPGSTFKILAGCAALEERLLQPSDSFYVDKGEADVGGFTIHDSHPETRWYTFRDATALSSNVCYAHIGTKVGAKTLYGYARLFGFGQPTRIMLPGEAPGQIRHPDRWSGRSLATISIGQEVLVTPLQILMAYCAIANGGELLRPRVVSTVVDDQGAPIREVPVEHVRRVVSSETARTFRSFLRDAVVSGTAIEAALPWCEVAGKTGTAQKALENGRGYGAGCYVSSFVGMAPYENPSVVGLIVIDEPRGGSTTAAPSPPPSSATSSPRGRSRDAVRSRSLRPRWCAVRTSPRRGWRCPTCGCSSSTGRAKVLARAGYGLRVASGGAVGGRVMAQTPAPGTEIGGGAVIELALDTGGDGDTTVPDLRGLALRDALARLTASAIEVARVEGSGTVVRQSLEAGRTVKKGTRCTLVLSPRGV
jgi:cell division protein FtsI (penicillin-binding protein 3)